VNSSILVEVAIKGEGTRNAKPFHNDEAGAINKAEYVIGVFAEDIQSLGQLSFGYLFPTLPLAAAEVKL